MSNSAIEIAPPKQIAGKAAWIILAIAWICFLLPVPGLGIFIGCPLNFVAFILAIVAMVKGGAMKGIWQLLASLIASPIIYSIGLAIFGAVISKGSYDHYKEQAKAAQPVAAFAADAKAAPAEDVIKVSAKQLYSAYKANEIAADGKYKGKPLKISGTVNEIESNFMDEPTINLAGGDGFGFVHLEGVDKASASGLSKGQKITAVCKGSGEVVGFPTADSCTIQ